MRSRNYLEKPVDNSEDVLYNVYVTREKAAQAAVHASSIMSRNELETIAAEALEKKYHSDRKLFASHYDDYVRTKNASDIKRTS